MKLISELLNLSKRLGGIFEKNKIDSQDLYFWNTFTFSIVRAKKMLNTNPMFSLEKLETTSREYLSESKAIIEHKVEESDKEESLELYEKINTTLEALISHIKCSSSNLILRNLNVKSGQGNW